MTSRRQSETVSLPKRPTLYYRLLPTRPGRPPAHGFLFAPFAPAGPESPCKGANSLVCAPGGGSGDDGNRTRDRREDNPPRGALRRLRHRAWLLAPGSGVDHDRRGARPGGHVSSLARTAFGGGLQFELQTERKYEPPKTRNPCCKAGLQPIGPGSPRLRALWTVWSVEVRILSGAFRRSPRNAGCRSTSSAAWVPATSTPHRRPRRAAPGQRDGVRGGHDPLEHLLRVGDHGAVARRDLDRVGPHPLCELPRRVAELARDGRADRPHPLRVRRRPEAADQAPPRRCPASRRGA